MVFPELRQLEQPCPSPVSPLHLIFLLRHRLHWPVSRCLQVVWSTHSNLDAPPPGISALAVQFGSTHIACSALNAVLMAAAPNGSWESERRLALGLLVEAEVFQWIERMRHDLLFC